MTPTAPRPNYIQQAIIRRYWKAASEMPRFQLMEGHSLFQDMPSMDGELPGAQSLFDHLLPTIRKTFPDAAMVEMGGRRFLSIPGDHAEFPMAVIEKTHGASLCGDIELS